MSRIPLTWCFLGLQDGLHRAPAGTLAKVHGGLEPYASPVPGRILEYFREKENGEGNRENKTLSIEFQLNSKIDSHPHLPAEMVAGELTWVNL